jgi:hypothetical protein
MRGMEEREEKRGGFGCAIGLALLLASLPGVYILSTGPFTWLEERGYVSHETAQATADVIYVPLRWMTYRCKSLEDFVLWWDSLFYA